MALYRNRISTIPSEASSLNTEGSFSDRDSISECSSIESSSSGEGDVSDQVTPEHYLVGVGVQFAGTVISILGSGDINDLLAME